MVSLSLSLCVGVQVERLVEVQKEIERINGNPEELRKGLQHVLDLDATWPYDKADLLHWAKVLDILDAVLAKDDSPEDLLIAVLKFSRLLLENCSNRHVYNSYEVSFSNTFFLSRFLLTFSLDIPLLSCTSFLLCRCSLGTLSHQINKCPTDRH